MAQTSVAERQLTPHMPAATFSGAPGGKHEVGLCFDGDPRRRPACRCLRRRANGCADLDNAAFACRLPNACANSFARSYTYCSAKGPNCDADSFAHCHGSHHNDANIDAHTYRNTYAHSRANSHADPDTHADACTYRHPFAYTRT